ncbi:MAG: membrane protein insertase YidC [Gammaproteobacteria bacterium]|jgi:YidC/Oxa1 family membrane protein insertase|nr:membrane protein insertase YidC [Gammaproteobacteria bacterium]
MENQRLLVYLSLALVLFMIWQAWQQDYGPVNLPGSAAVESRPSGEPSPAEDTPVPGDIPSVPRTEPEQAQGPDAQTIRVVTDVIDARISTTGGDIVQVKLPTYPVSIDEPDVPFTLLDDSAHVYIAQTGLVFDGDASGRDADELAPNHHAPFSAGSEVFELKDGEDELRVPLRWTGPDGVTVTKTYVFRRGSFLVDIEQSVENAGAEPWIGRQYRQIRHGAVAQDSGSRFVRTFTGAAYFDGKYEKETFEDITEEPLRKEIEAGWVAMLQHYFVSAFVAEKGEQSLVYTKAVRGRLGPEYLIGLSSVPQTAAPGQSVTFSTRLYAGPKLQHRLTAISPGLELVTDYGIFTVISKPLFWLLEKIHGLVGNWGWAIILLTVLIKLVFYKLSETSYRSMARMRAVQPKLAALKERYGSDKQRMNQALMDLYKKEKINPLGGCLPILVQIPVFIALYWTLLESVELRQAPFMFWIHDLSTKDPYYVLPLLMGITMFAQQKLNPAPLDPIQAKVMMALPFIFTVFFAFFPSGLVLYWFVNNLLSILQQWVITRRIEKQAR